MLVTIGKKYSYQKVHDRYFLWIMQWKESQSTRGLNTPMAYFSKHANSTRDFASLLVRFQMDMDRSKVPLCNRNLGTRNARVLTRDQSMTQVERRRIDVEALCYFIRSTTSLTLATFTVSEASITRSEIARTRACRVSRCTSVDLWNSWREGWLFLFAIEGESSRGKRISFIFKFRLEHYSASNMRRRLLGRQRSLNFVFHGNYKWTFWNILRILKLDLTKTKPKLRFNATPRSRRRINFGRWLITYSPVNRAYIICTVIGTHRHARIVF